MGGLKSSEKTKGDGSGLAGRRHTAAAGGEEYEAWEERTAARVGD